MDNKANVAVANADAVDAATESRRTDGDVGKSNGGRRDDLEMGKIDEGEL